MPPGISGVPFSATHPDLSTWRDITRWALTDSNAEPHQQLQKTLGLFNLDHQQATR